MRSLLKKNQYRTGICSYPNGNEMDQMIPMTSHVIVYQSTELLFGTHMFNFNCFFDDFNCIFTQIRCLSRLPQNEISIGRYDLHCKYIIWNKNKNYLNKKQYANKIHAMHNKLFIKILSKINAT